ncbi:hypothetical protein G5I_03301 [Acromyrmex echinatior]|uniref:Uncharacterized protein n=1 Tax=Acromyrmex echinatior TaxID=103372 RepID=F4WCM5_ACREC|nr:hypothetical protein G5I_03301 [Acromyrmex echinatior]
MCVVCYEEASEGSWRGTGGEGGLGRHQASAEQPKAPSNAGQILVFLFLKKIWNLKKFYTLPASIRVSFNWHNSKVHLWVTNDSSERHGQIAQYCYFKISITIISTREASSSSVTLLAYQNNYVGIPSMMSNVAKGFEHSSNQIGVLERDNWYQEYRYPIKFKHSFEDSDDETVNRTRVKYVLETDGPRIFRHWWHVKSTVVPVLPANAGGVINRIKRTFGNRNKYGKPVGRGQHGDKETEEKEEVEEMDEWARETRNEMLELIRSVLQVMGSTFINSPVRDPSRGIDFLNVRVEREPTRQWTAGGIAASRINRALSFVRFVFGSKRISAIYSASKEDRNSDSGAVCAYAVTSGTIDTRREAKEIKRQGENTKTSGRRTERKIRPAIKSHQKFHFAITDAKSKQNHGREYEKEVHKTLRLNKTHNV